MRSAAKPTSDDLHLYIFTDNWQCQSGRYSLGTVSDPETIWHNIRSVYILLWNLFYYYHPPTKWCKGKVFSHVCLSVCSQGGSHDHYPWCIWPHWVSYLTVQGLPLPSPQRISDLTVQGSLDMFKLPPYETCTAGKWAVCFLLECFILCFLNDFRFDSKWHFTMNALETLFTCEH